MKRFVVTLENGWDRFFTCQGDELNLCEGCIAKFYCYTGELPNEYCSQPYEGVGRYDEAVEYHLFGNISLNVIDYDFLTHNKYSRFQADILYRDGSRYKRKM